MVDERRKEHSSLEWFRLVTPLLVTIALFMIGGVKGDVGKLDDKVFKHFTNDEIHIPRGMIVTQAEFDMRCKFADATMAENKQDLKEAVCDINKNILDMGNNIRSEMKLLHSEQYKPYSYASQPDTNKKQK